MILVSFGLNDIDVYIFVLDKTVIELPVVPFFIWKVSPEKMNLPTSFKTEGAFDKDSMSKWVKNNC